jgi:hypothetical protein
MGSRVCVCVCVCVCVYVGPHRSSLYQGGWPNYLYGSTNTLRLSTTVYPRIGQVALYLGYVKLSNKQGQENDTTVQWTRAKISDNQ